MKRLDKRSPRSLTKHTDHSTLDLAAASSGHSTLRLSPRLREARRTWRVRILPRLSAEALLLLAVLMGDFLDPICTMQRGEMGRFLADIGLKLPRPALALITGD